MNWYVKNEHGEIRGPMTQESAEFESGRLDDSLMFNDRIFELVTTKEVEDCVTDLRDLIAHRGRSVIMQQAIFLLDLLSREKLIVGKLKDGCVTFDPLPAGVRIRIRNCDVRATSTPSQVSNWREDEDGFFVPLEFVAGG